MKQHERRHLPNVVHSFLIHRWGNFPLRVTNKRSHHPPPLKKKKNEITQYDSVTRLDSHRAIQPCRENSIAEACLKFQKAKWNKKSTAPTPFFLARVYRISFFLLIVLFFRLVGIPTKQIALTIHELILRGLRGWRPKRRTWEPRPASFAKAVKLGLDTDYQNNDLSRNLG